MGITQDKSEVELFKEHMRALFSQYAAQRRSEAVRRGMKSMVLQGYSPTQPPLGYKRTTVKGLYQPNRLGNAIANILRKLAHDKITVNEAMVQLKLLTEANSDRKMTAEKLIRLMSNPYYAGILYYQGKQYTGKHAVLITSEQHKVILDALCNLPEKSEG